MPRPRRKRSASGKSVEALRHEADTRTNIPTAEYQSAEYQSMVREDTESLLRVAYQRRNRDLDPQLVWRSKDEQGLDDLAVNAPPLYIQVKAHPKALIVDLLRQSRNGSPPLTAIYSDFQVMGSVGTVVRCLIPIVLLMSRRVMIRILPRWRRR